MGLFHSKPNNDMQRIAHLKSTMIAHELEFENAYLKRQIRGFVEDGGIASRFVESNRTRLDPQKIDELTTYLNTFSNYIKQDYFL